MKLRPYQTDSVDASLKFLRDNAPGRNGIIVAPTGSGKSIIIAELCKRILTRWPEKRICIVQHRKELIEQNAYKILQIWPDAPIGIYSAGLKKKQVNRITVGGIQTIANKTNELGWRDLIIVDECFTGDTKISTPTGNKRIDLLRCGDLVYNANGVGVVKAISCREANKLIRIKFSDGTKITCTENHPIFTNNGWTKAEALEVGSFAFSQKALRLMLERVQSLEKKWVSNEGKGLEQTVLLLSKLLKEVEEPNEQSSVSIKNARNTKKNKASAYKAWRERMLTNITSTCVASCARRGVGIRSRCPNKSGTWEWYLSESLQNRYSKQRENDRNRIGWRIARRDSKKRTGSKEIFSPYFPRVVDVSVIESKSARAVFNLHVSGHPSYFANEKLVHNCHLIPKDGQGQYRKFIEGIQRFNSKVRIIGLTATAFRLDSGLLTSSAGSIFTDTIYEISLRHLIDEGFLSNLVSKVSGVQVDLEGVRTRGGEYVPGDIEKACDKDDLIDSTVRDIIMQAANRTSWILFCSGVQHATHVAEKLTQLGIVTAVITGETPSGERARIISDFKAKKIRAITNCDVLTTGFDAPAIDVVALLRPTKSTGLYVQMVGRGSRLSPGKRNCMVLDYAGNIERHGPIDEITIKERRGRAEISHRPCRQCPSCGTMLGISLKKCTECGFEFPEAAAHVATASEKPILAEVEEFDIRNVVYSKHVKSTESLRVTYEVGFNSFINQFLPFADMGFRGIMARKFWQSATGVIGSEPTTVDEALERIEELGWPVKVRAKKVKKYYEVVGVTFDIEVDKWGKVENRDRGLPF